MARKYLSIAEILYFCNVKIYERQMVAGLSSVFRAHKLLVKIYPSVCGSGNTRKGSARKTLTARTGILYCQKYE